MCITLAVCPRDCAPPNRGAPDATVKSGASVAVDEPQELGARACIFAESSQHLAGDHGDAAFVHAACGHALMNRIEHHGDAAWPQHAIDAACDLCSELLVYLEAAGVAVDDACELADADDFVGRQVADVRAADDRRHVMLAMRLE